MAVDARHHRMPLGRLAELAGEGDVLLRAEVLLGEEHDLVVEPGAADRRNGVGVELACQVDTVDDGADVPGQGGDVELALLVDDGHAGVSRSLVGAG